MDNKKYLFLIFIITLVITSIKIVNPVNAQIITGKDWTKAADTSAFSPRSLHQMFVFKDKLFLIGGRGNNGNNNDVWCSNDGVIWSLVTNNIGFEFEYGTRVVVLNDTIWLNSNKDIWNSTDGMKWNKVTTINGFPKYGKNMLVFKNKIWLTGGADIINEYLPNGEYNPNMQVIFKNDVWSSSNGTEWNKENTQNCFVKRTDHCGVVFNNKMWVIAGQAGLNKNDVWCSDDGINWVQVTYAPFSGRHMTQAAVFQNKIWVIAGFTQDSQSNPTAVSDVWCSSDGKNWEQITSSAPFDQRQEHQAIVFKDRLWIIGGYCGAFNETERIYKNDIWYTESSQTDVKINSITETFLLSQNYPNPFNPETVISYRLPATSQVQLKVFDMLGREITTLVDKEQTAGSYEVKFDGTNLPSGIYLYKMRTSVPLGKAGSSTQTNKMMLMR